MTRQQRVAIIALVVPLVAYAALRGGRSGRDGLANAPAAAPVMDATRPHQERIRDFLLRAAEQMPEEHFAFRPVPEVRSFGEILAHIADTQFYFCASVLGEENPVSENLERTHTTKADLIEVLESSFEFCDRAYALSDAEATHATEVNGRTRVPLLTLILNVAHNWEHYGNLVTYMRMQGFVPPSSAPRS